ncbi:hypothetical protein LCGC14_2291850 [marine sediment metagenome]|uniref:HTH arsR-type domain-containing protein n=1 Tax=marine sediment metagenome TaxID=412755 RepID=A0A0F9CR21_9ZZZZ
MLEELFFHKKVARVIEHFVIHEKWKQNKKEICEILEIYPELMKEILEKLVEYELIVVTNKIARSKFYKINKQSKLLPFLRGLIQEFGMQRSLKIAEEELNKEELPEKEKIELKHKVVD